MFLETVIELTENVRLIRSGDIVQFTWLIPEEGLVLNKLDPELNRGLWASHVCTVLSKTLLEESLRFLDSSSPIWKDCVFAVETSNFAGYGLGHVNLDVLVEVKAKEQTITINIDGYSLALVEGAPNLKKAVFNIDILISPEEGLQIFKLLSKKG